MKENSRIAVFGHNGFVGRNLIAKLRECGYNNIITAPRLNLTNQDRTDFFFSENEIEYVYNCAAVVGGISYNIKKPFKFLMDNLMIQNNIINSSMKHHVKKVLMLGSSCIYPKDYPHQPLKEEYLLAGPLEPTNEAYALAKIAGLKLAQYANYFVDGTKFISLMPCNLYGPNDHFNLETSHALAALVVKVGNAIDTAKKLGASRSEIEVWGSGKQKREWLYVDDLIDCMIWALKNMDHTDTFLNVGTGIDINMNELAKKIVDLYGVIDDTYYNISIKNNIFKLDGMMKKCLDVSNINHLGWKAQTSLDVGLEKTIRWYRENLYGKDTE